MRRIRNVFLPSAAVLATVVVTAVALAQGESDQGSRAHSPSTAPSVSTNPADLGAFARARTSEDNLPTVAANEVDSIGPEGTVVPDSVKAAELGDRSVYLTPAPDAVCLALAEQSLGAAVNCVPLKAVNEGSAAPSFVMTECTGPPPEEGPPVCDGFVLYGVVPDGVDEVTIEGTTRSTEVAVSDNAFIYEGPMAQAVRSIRYVTGSGQEVRLPVPL